MASDQAWWLTRAVAYFIAHMMCTLSIGYALYLSGLVDTNSPRDRPIFTGAGVTSSMMLRPFVQPYVQKLFDGSYFRREVAVPHGQVKPETEMQMEIPATNYSALQLKDDMSERHRGPVAFMHR
ncbi:hypothetical protein B0A55_02195 [Friedmanniomyces simplex]|uniref:Uncharacterized protein n=1 Tax=Friedmanniomyces simplex TaxID=329884 RepID=A0A4U0Y0C7_9PEZI|nr:hypothetical protein B0A55_02195 [Friedmanniomyces simplex]